MLKDKSGILYSGNFEGTNLRYISEFSSKKQLERLIKDFIKNNFPNSGYQRYIHWDEVEDIDRNVDVTIDYGSHSKFLLVIYD